METRCSDYGENEMSGCRIAGDLVISRELEKLMSNVQWLKYREELREHIAGQLRLYLDSPSSINLHDDDRTFLENLAKVMP
jgi:hypothetical protein